MVNGAKEMRRKEPTLQDLTKGELIELFQRYIFEVDIEELAFIIYHRECRQTLAKMDRLSRQMSALDLNRVGQREDLYFEASHEWDMARERLKNIDEEYQARKTRR